MTLLSVAALVASACGANEQAVCGSEQHAFEASNIHVLPGTEISYELSPPTSGPHTVPAPDPGIYRTPISEPLQVGAVEAGTVIVHYGKSLPVNDIEAWEALALDRPVIVAPAARTLDDDATIAFTAWGVRQLCLAVDLDAARLFIDSHSFAPERQHG